MPPGHAFISGRNNLSARGGQPRRGGPGREQEICTVVVLNELQMVTLLVLKTVTGHECSVIPLALSCCHVDVILMTQPSFRKGPDERRF